MRKHPSLPRQMHATFERVETIRLGDLFHNETGFEVADLLASVKRLESDDRLNAISAQEY